MIFRAYFSRLFVIVAMTLLVSAFAVGQQITSITFSANPVLGGAKTVGTVVLSAAAPAGGITVNLSSSTAAATVPASVTVAAGKKQGPFTITAAPVTTNQITAIKGIDPGGISASANLTVSVQPIRLIKLSVAPASVPVPDPSVGTVTLSAAAPDAGLTIKLTSADPAATVPASVVVPGGVTTATFPITTHVVAANTTVALAAKDPVGYTANTSVIVRVAAVRVKSLTLAPASVEFPNVSKGTVILTANAPEAGFVVNLASSKGFATVPASVTVPSGTAKATFTINTSAVAAPSTATISGAETIGYKVSADLAVNLPAIRLTGLAITPNSVTASSSATGTVTLSANAPAAGFVVNLASSKEFAIVPASVKVAAGASEATFTIQTKPVTANSSVSISGTDVNGFKASAPMSVTLPTVRVAALSLSPVSVIASASSTGTVTLSNKAPTGGFLVSLASDKTFATVPTSVLVSAGTKTATFPVTTTAVPADSNANITASDATGYVATAPLAVTVPASHLTTLSVTPTTITAANSATATITLSAKAPAGGIVITLSSPQTFLILPATVTLNEGVQSATFTVGTKPVTSAGNATINGSDPYGYTAKVNVTVKVPTVRLTTLTINPATVTAGTSVTGTVKLSAVAPAGGFSVTLSTMQTYVTPPMNVTVPAGVNSVTFSVPTTSVTATSTASISGMDTNGYVASGTVTVNPLPTSYTVSMTASMTFSPKSLSVPAGATVIWSNDDHLMGHSVKPDLAITGMDSDVQYPNTIPMGKTFSWTVPASATPGTVYYYHCKLHGSPGNGKAYGTGMVGVIVVK